MASEEKKSKIELSTVATIVSICGGVVSILFVIYQYQRFERERKEREALKEQNAQLTNQLQATKQ